MNRHKEISAVGSILLGLMRLVFWREWIRITRWYPPEQVYLRVISPNGERIALFSVRHQVSHRLAPAHIAPKHYLTTVDAAYGRVLFRGTALGTLRESFLALAEKQAPWATEAVKSEVSDASRQY